VRDASQIRAGEQSKRDPVSAPQSASRIGADFKTRAVSAIVLLAIVLAGVAWSPATFSVLVLAITALISWEWSRMIRGADVDAAMALHVAAALGAACFSIAGRPGLGIVVLLAAAIGTFVLCAERHPIQSALGVFYSGLPAIALVWLRTASPHGLDAILYLLLVVIATDTGAYFAGRLIGGPKLWPRISPNKTWSGLGGAIAAAASTGMLFALWLQGPVFRLAAMAAVLAVIAQGGDLAESALKRRFGAKDTSALIPGHGGFMDRVDGLVAAAVAAALLAWFVNAAAPARALLFGA
jgi:phosphatidate cytidylyltransferase